MRFRERWSIVLGAHDRRKDEPSAQRIRIKRAFHHPFYSQTTIYADHALIELEKPAILNDRVVLACLPESGNKIDIGTDDCYIAGRFRF